MGWLQQKIRAWAGSLVSESVNLDDLGYRRLTTDTSNRLNLNPLDQDTIINVVRALYQLNPGARRLIEIPVDYGYKVSYRFKNDKVQDVVDKFWYSPINDMPRFIGQIVESYNLFGELLLPTEVNPQNGFVKITYEEPIDIGKIEGFKNNKRLVDVVEMKSEPGKPPKRYKIIRYIEDPLSTLTIGTTEAGNEKQVGVDGFRVGDAFYFRSGHLITGRGRPPLEPIIDWLDAHDHALFDQLRNVALQAAHVWDVTLKGAGEDKIAAKAQQIKEAGPMKPGTVKIHNENEIWEAKCPQIESRIATELLVQVRKYFGLGMGKSETWLAASEDVNRATSLSADQPPLKHLEQQLFVQELMVKEIINFVIDQAIIYGSLPASIEDREFEVVMPDLTTADNRLTAESLKLLVDAMSIAMSEKIADVDTGRTLFYKMADMEIPENIDELFPDAEMEQRIPPSKFIQTKDRSFTQQKVASDGLPSVK